MLRKCLVIWHKAPIHIVSSSCLLAPENSPSSPSKLGKPSDVLHPCEGYLCSQCKTLAGPQWFVLVGALAAAWHTSKNFCLSPRSSLQVASRFCPWTAVTASVSDRFIGVGLQCVTAMGFDGTSLGMPGVLSPSSASEFTKRASTRAL
jgi:hypothetical protein